MSVSNELLITYGIPPEKSRLTHHLRTGSYSINMRLDCHYVHTHA